MSEALQVEPKQKQASKSAACHVLKTCELFSCFIVRNIFEAWTAKNNAANSKLWRRDYPEGRNANHLASQNPWKRHTYVTHAQSIIYGEFTQPTLYATPRKSGNENSLSLL